MDVPTGTLVAAVIETVGYHSQAAVLDGLTRMFFRVGIFLYAISVAFAIATYAMTSSFQHTKWLIICPGLFCFLVFTRVDAPGAVWRFGTFDDARDGFNSLPEVMAKQYPDYDSDMANVSWFFNRWNVLISNVYNELIKVITHNDSFRAQVRFMTRAQLADIVSRVTIQDPGLESLIVTGLSGYCSASMNALRDIAYAKANPTYASISTSLQNSLATVQDLYTGERFTFKQGGPARMYLIDLLPRLSRLGDNTRDALNAAFCEGIDQLEGLPEVEDDSEDDFGDDYDYDYDSYYGFEDAISSFTCEQLWCWATFATYLESLKLAEMAECRYTPRLLHRCNDNDSLDLLHNGLGLDEMRDEIMGELWEDVALKLLSPDLYTELTQNPGRANLNYIPIVMTGTLIRKALTKDPRSYLTNEYAENGGVYAGGTGYDTEALQVSDLHEDSTAEARLEQGASLRYESFVFASRIPYVQGGLLYGLAVLFPFFALFVLLPGKASTIFTWMALWAWVKSWDVGYALVMVAEDIVWSLMPASSEYHSILTSSSENGPLQLLEGAFNSSPSYHLSTYYMVMASLIMAVPMVTAQFILGVQGAVAGSIMGRMQGLGSNIQQGQFVIAESRKREQGQKSSKSSKSNKIGKSSGDVNSSALSSSNNSQEESS